jgi:hypothetical protein
MRKSPARDAGHSAIPACLRYPEQLSHARFPGSFPRQGEYVNDMNASGRTAPVIPPHPSSANGGWLSAFPLRTFLELGAYRSAAGSARGHARNVLAEWRLSHLEDAVTLILSELVTNSVNAAEKETWEAGRPPVRLWLLGRPGTSSPGTSSPGTSGDGAGGGGEVMVLVWDAVAEVPADPGLADELAESGRGLWMARRYRTRLDFYRPRWAYGGKVARALIDRPAPLEHLVAACHPGETLPDDY